MAGHFLFEMLRLMRPQQWVKNGFVLAPYFFAATHPGARELLPLGIATPGFLPCVQRSLYLQRLARSRSRLVPRHTGSAVVHRIEMRADGAILLIQDIVGL
jgi:hypothetical protein